MLLHDFLTESAGKFPDKTALIFKEQRITYQELDQRANKLAHALIALGVERGARVAIFLDNSPESVIALFGVLKAGAAFIMLNAALKAGKLGNILSQSGAGVLISHRNKRGILDSLAVPASMVKIIIGEDKEQEDKGQEGKGQDNAFCPACLTWDKVMVDHLHTLDRIDRIMADPPGHCPPGHRPSVQCPSAQYPPGQYSPAQYPPGQYSPAQYSPVPCPPSDLCPERRNIDLDLAAIVYTSGSTGDPKGVMMTHLNMVCAATSITSYLKNTSDDIIMNVLPLSFNYGLYQVLMAVMFGGTVVLEKSFLYPYAVIEKMIREKVTGFPLVPTLAVMILQMESLKSYDFSSLRYITNAGAALPESHIRKLKAVFPQAAIYSMYGLTECTRVSYLPPEELDRRPNSVGKPMPNVEAFIVDEKGNEVGPGVVGELVVRGSNVMRGYWNDPDGTNRVLKAGRYQGEQILYTGDFFRMDEEGYLFFVSRKDDLIKTRGERVSPREVENVLCQIDGVCEAAVIGVPDDLLGQAIKAFILAGQGSSVGEKEIIAHCMNRLEFFMVPKYIEFLSEFPRTGTGKIDRKKLAMIAKKEQRENKKISTCHYGIK
jgi:acyl-CoA synthetase (AMP-forming)/AMP-acid ligase II